MLKLIAALLLLINLSLFAWYRGYLEPVWPSGREPQRLQQQIEPEKIRLLAATPSPPPSPSPPVAAPGPVAKAVVAPTVASCVELGNFSETESTRFEAQIGALALGERLSRRTVTDATSFMVYIPPQADKEAVERKSGELRRLDIKDFYVMQAEGDLHYAISLGIFKTRAAAESHLAELVRKGVHSARVGGRGAGSDKVVFQLRDLTDSGLASVLSLTDTFSKVERRECAAGAR